MGGKIDTNYELLLLAKHCSDNFVPCSVVIFRSATFYSVLSEKLKSYRNLLRRDLTKFLGNLLSGDWRIDRLFMSKTEWSTRTT